MSRDKLIFAQVMAHLPLTTFRRCVARYRGENVAVFPERRPSEFDTFSCKWLFLLSAGCRFWHYGRRRWLVAD
jgi:hypothetical protein